MERPIWMARNHITKMPKARKLSCQTQRDGRPKGPQVDGTFRVGEERVSDDGKRSESDQEPDKRERPGQRDVLPSIR